MPVNYRRLNATASRLLRENGKDATLSSVAVGAYDVETGTASETTTTQTVNSLQLKYERDEIDGTTVIYGDVKLMVSPNITRPNTGDTCTLDGVLYAIKSVQEEKPASIVMFYILQLRQT